MTVAMPGMEGGIAFLVCIETAAGSPAPALRQRLERWRARRCLDRCWIITANTTSRIVYDSLATEIDDRDRILVCELDEEVVWYNLDSDAGELMSSMRHSPSPRRARW